MRDVVMRHNPATSQWRTPSDVVQAPPTAALAKVAYFIASHVNPEQVVRLVRACRSSGNPDARVCVHHDYKVSNLDAKVIERLGNVDVLKDHAPVEWGGFTQCVMIRRSMQWLLDNRDVEWVVYLSGQDYPIKPLATIERELAQSTFDGYLRAKPAEEYRWHTGVGRYLYQYYELPKFPGYKRVRQYLRDRGQRLVASGVDPRFNVPNERHGEFKVGYRPFFHSPFSDGFRCIYGSSWWTLNRRAIGSMCRAMDERRDLVKHYRRILWAPNESFFMTLLMNDPSLNLCTTNNKRMIRWTHPETGHPDTLKSEDWTEILASDAHFARKVDSRVDAGLLDLLDRHIGVES